MTWEMKHHKVVLLEKNGHFIGALSCAGGRSYTLYDLRGHVRRFDMLPFAGIVDGVLHSVMAIPLGDFDLCADIKPDRVPAPFDRFVVGGMRVPDRVVKAEA